MYHTVGIPKYLLLEEVNGCMNMILAFCDRGAGSARLPGRQKSDLSWLKIDAGLVRTNRGSQDGMWVCYDPLGAHKSRDPRAYSAGLSPQPGTRFSLGEQKTKAAVASILSSPVFRMFMWGLMGHVKIPGRCISLLHSSGIYFLKVSWNLEKLLSGNRSNEWRHVTHSPVHLRSKVH